MSLLDFFDFKYPRTDNHVLNLDWCISAILEMQAAWAGFTAGNKLIFADPLQHDLTKTYAKNTIVIGDNGNAYLSLQPVPKGVQLSDTDYWLMVFDFTDYSERANKNFTDNYFENVDRSPVSLAIGDWLVLNDVLYKVVSAISPDDLFEVGVNIVHFTVEQFLKDFILTVNNTLYQYSLTIQQYKNDIDASELEYRQQLAQDIADTTASLQAQLTLAISGVTVDSEVINARLGADGVTYPSLGDAIRTQVGLLDNAIDEFAVRGFINDNLIDYKGNLFFPDNPSISASGYNYGSTCANAFDLRSVADPNFYCFYIPVKENTSYYVSRAGIRFVFFDSTFTTISMDSIADYGPASTTTPAGCRYLGINTDANVNSLIVVEGTSSDATLAKQGTFQGVNKKYPDEVRMMLYLMNNIDESINMFSKYNPTIVDDGLIYTQNTTNFNDRYQVLDHSFYSLYIPVEPETTYTTSFAGLFMLYFDLDGNFISREVVPDYGEFTFTTPVGCYYVGINSKQNKNQMMIVKGGTLPVTYVSGESKIKWSDTLEKIFTSDESSPITIDTIKDFYIDGSGYTLDLGTHFTATAGDNYLEITYAADHNSHIYNVCVSHSENPIYSSSIVTRYNTTLWAHYSDETRDYRLVPVTSSSDLANTPESFYYDGTTIYINTSDPADEYVLADDEGSSRGIYITHSRGKICNLTVKYARAEALRVDNSSYCELYNCSFKFGGVASSVIAANESTVILNSCEVFKSVLDGMDTASDGTVSTMIENDCHCHYCLDDGSSHHKGVFYINGGEFDHNHKSGIGAPCYLSVGNIKGAFIHDNDINGVYAVNDPDMGLSNFTISDCLFKDNARNYYLSYVDCTAYNNKYVGTPTYSNYVDNCTLNDYDS